MRFGWLCGAVVSGVRRMNEVNARRARLVLGWVTVFGRVYIRSQYVTSQLGQLSFASPGVVRSNTSFGWGKCGTVTSAGWQVTLCDPIWHMWFPVACANVSSWTAISVYFTLLYFVKHWWNREMHSRTAILSGYINCRQCELAAPGD